jgi:hypothetical protein
MRNDTEREERAMWKLSEGGYSVRKDGQGYIVTGPGGAEMTLVDLATLIEYANAVYERVWTGGKITPSA